MLPQLLVAGTCWFLRRISIRAAKRPSRLASMASFWPDLLASELSPQISASLAFLAYRYTAALTAWQASPFEAALDGVAAVACVSALVPSLKLVLPLLTSRQEMLRALRDEAGLKDEELPLTKRGLTWRKALISLFPLPVFTGLARNIETRRGVTFAVATSTVKRRSKAEHQPGSAAAGPVIEAPFVLHEDHHPRITSTSLSLAELPSQSILEAASDAIEASTVMWRRGKRAAEEGAETKILTDLKLDLFWHKTRGPQAAGSGQKKKAPIVLIIHGGGWVVGHSINSNLPLIYSLAREGCLVASVNYRLAPGAHFPSQLIDVKAAIVWLKQHAHQFNADPDFVVTMGESAGGHLSLLAGLTGNVPEFAVAQQGQIQGQRQADTSVQGIVDLYGVSDWLDAKGTIHGAGEGFRNWLGRVVLQTDSSSTSSSSSSSSKAETLAEFISASPRWWLEGPRLRESLAAEGVIEEENRSQGGTSLFPASADAVMRRVPSLMSADGRIRPVPPILIVHGIADNLVPCKDSEELWSALQARRRRTTRGEGEQAKAMAAFDVFIRLPSTHHAFNYLVSARSLALSDAVCDWLNALRKRCENETG